MFTHLYSRLFSTAARTCITLNEVHGHPLLDLSRISQERRAKLFNDFILYPNFLNEHEQIFLLKNCLLKLDKTGSRAERRKAQSHLEMLPPNVALAQIFRSNYSFEEGHFDNVIKEYREMRVTSWGDSDTLSTIIKRVQSLLPDPEPTKIQTHLVHLSSDGFILSHVDNIEASGSTIVGVSLGGERILRMENVDDENEKFDVLLPSGSAYIQRDEVRYGFKHSVLKRGTFLGREVEGGQRVSLMMRDRVR